MSGRGKTILIVGFGRFTLSPNAGTIVEKIQLSIKQAEEAGYNITMLEVNPEEPKASLAKVREALKSNKFHGLQIGYGLRATKETTLLFEDVVNCARELSPETKLLFPTAPDAIVETLERL